MTTRRLRRLSVLCLLGLAPAFGHADEGVGLPGRTQPRQGPGRARNVEPTAARGAAAPVTSPIDVLRERLLAAGPLEGQNALEGYLSGDIHPTRAESVGRHLFDREAGRRWRRLVAESLNERYVADPSYGAHQLGLDKRRMSEAWHNRDADGLEGLHVARVAPPVQVAPRDCGLYRSRFVGVDRDLRLRMNFKELFGVVIGDGPEDEFEFDRPRRERLRRDDSPRLPRVQLRGRARVRLDTRAIATGAALHTPVDSYGGTISVDILSPSRASKILTAFFEMAFRTEGESEMTFGLKRRF